MVHRVLQCPLSFFEDNPRGRILNRFSVDLDFLDSRFYICTKLSLQNILISLAYMALVGTQSFTVLVVGAVAAFFIGFSLVSSSIYNSVHANQGNHIFR